MRYIIEYILRLFADKREFAYRFDIGDKVFLRPIQYPKHQKGTYERILKLFGPGPFVTIETYEVEPGSPPTKKLDPWGLGQHVHIRMRYIERKDDYYRSSWHQGTRSEWFHSWWLIPASQEDEIKKRVAYPEKLLDQYTLSWLKIWRVLLIITALLAFIYFSIIMPSAYAIPVIKGIIVGVLADITILLLYFIGRDDFS